ncbi:MAG: type 1 glutamine amidotransferase domain-containing protein [Dongiaceae bacterium]
MAQLSGKKVAIVATDGFEQSELERPLEALRQAGATAHVISPRPGEIRGWETKDWGRAVAVDRTLDDASPGEYDALVLPGGQINPDLLRVEPKAVDFVRQMFRAGKPVAAICHGPWLLIEADVVRGRRATSYKSIRTDLRNAGAQVVDEPVVVDQGLITSRQPDDLDAFCRKLVEEIGEGAHGERRAAAGGRR